MCYGDNNNAPRTKNNNNLAQQTGAHKAAQHHNGRFK